MPLDYDKYLVGRPYLLFKSAVRSEKSLQTYRQNLWHFCHFIVMSTDEIVSKYGGGNGKEAMKLQQMVEDYVLLLQVKISNGEITAATGQTMIPPVTLLCEMNDIILNWRKINRLLPRSDRDASDDAYTREQIKKMLEYSDLRAKIPILFMSSGGMRLGGFISLTDGTINPIYDDKNNKLIAAHVTIYKGTDEEYDTFVSPEAFRVYEEYRNLRIKFGEQITKNSPIFLKRFDISPDGKTARIDNSGPIALSTVTGILRTVAHKAGVREVSENYKGRYNIKIAHGFRKFFSTTLSSIKTRDGRTAIDFIKKEWLLGHALRTIHSLEENYNRSDRIKLLLPEYQKAVKEMTISDEERLQVDVEKLQTDISNMKSVSVELQEKDKQIIELMRRQEQMEKKFQMIFEKIDSGRLS
jgi:integrase